MKRQARLEAWVAFLLPAALGLALGMLAHRRALVDLDTVAAMGSAWRVFHWQGAANMALLGFDQPPLMALLFVPFGAFAPRMLVSGIAAPLLGTLFLGLSVVILWRLSRTLGLPAWLALILCAVFTLHPLVLSYATLGSRGIVLTFVLIGLAASLVSWQREERVRDLVTGSFFAAAAILLAYETVALVIAAALYLASCCRAAGSRTVRAASGCEASVGAESPSHTPTPAPRKAEGLLLAFLLPAAYVGGVWIIANWAIMGHPWYFLHRAGPTIDLAHLPGGGGLGDALQVWLVVNPLLLALLYHAIWRRTLATPALWLLAASLLSAMVFSTYLVRERAWLWAYLMPIAATAAGVGFVLLGTVLAELTGNLASFPQRRTVSPGTLLVLAGSLALGVYLWTSDPRLPLDIRATLRGYPSFARNVTAEWQAADRLRTEWNPALPHAIGSVFGYVVALRAEATQEVTVPGTRRPFRWTRRPYPQPGSYIVAPEEPGLKPSDWASPRPDLSLQPRWRIGDWQAWQFTQRPAAVNGQPSSSDAIIAPGAPHARPRR